MKKQLSGILILMGTTIIWGSAFIAQSVGMDKIGPFTFQAISYPFSTVTVSVQLTKCVASASAE